MNLTARGAGPELGIAVKFAASVVLKMNMSMIRSSDRIQTGTIQIGTIIDRNLKKIPLQ
jgi:hypothetical protein